MSGRCKCCDRKLFEHEMIESKEGLCNVCLAESGKEYNIVNDHRYEHEYLDEGMSQPKSVDY